MASHPIAELMTAPFAVLDTILTKSFIVAALLLWVAFVLGLIGVGMLIGHYLL